ncbi:DUF1972 domain-containing protein [Erysipelothrix rhusiopathiae]|uniref:Glycosyltransferase family 4 protein n=1 Tax=Erysipelothrix rhusiopathiae TaxID=1648 RepID=A0A6S6I2E2_ERYRH|nr:DUF1972 domain-containing protein [Erysipelothrix rhusiopathiae]BCB22707.1 glycosyltransferase family 4 protein [Erysipelothrix rhusiopathiae]
MKNVFIIGSKGIPSNYGGFETFVDKLTEHNKEDINYHVSCLSNNDDEFVYNNARCFNISVPNIGPAKAVYYDVAALKRTIGYIRFNKIENPIIYILACRIGPFMWKYRKEMDTLNIEYYLNPDGHEWKRAKWNYFIRKYWKISEKLMIKHSDLVICDSKNIESYVQKNYKANYPKTTYIAYGADIPQESDDLNFPKYFDYITRNKVSRSGYYLIVGRFVPENNFETMILEYMKSKTTKDLVIITNIENNKFYKNLKKNTQFDSDSRIKFVGTVYDQNLLKLIRKHAYGYIHGHEVGGTNPSLLEALASTKLNLLLDVGFNSEVGEDSCLYWSKCSGSLSNLINQADLLDEQVIEKLNRLSTERIINSYSWDKISREYSDVFLNRREK